MANPPADIPNFIAAITALIGSVTGLAIGVARLLALALTLSARPTVTGRTSKRRRVA